MTTTVLVNAARVEVPVINRFGEEVAITITIEDLVIDIPEGLVGHAVDEYIDHRLKHEATDEAWDSPHLVGNGGEYLIREDETPTISQCETVSREEAERLFRKWNSVAAQYRRKLDLMDQATQESYRRGREPAVYKCALSWSSFRQNHKEVLWHLYDHHPQTIRGTTTSTRRMKMVPQD